MEKKEKQKKIVHLIGGRSFDLNECKIVHGCNFDSKGQVNFSENLALTPAGTFFIFQGSGSFNFTNIKEIDPKGALNWVRNQKLYPSQLPVEMVRVIEQKAGKMEEEQSNLLNRKSAAASSSAGAIKPTEKKSSEKRMVYLETGKFFDLNACKMVTGLKYDTSGHRNYTDKLVLTPSGTFLSCQETATGSNTYRNFKELDRTSVLNWVNNHNLSFSNLPTEMLEKLNFNQI